MEENKNSCEALTQEKKKKQSFSKALLFGVLASLIASCLWALFVAITKYRVGIMAIVVGAIVGLTIKHTGKGLNKTYGILGAFLALLSCALGDFLSTAYLASSSMKIDYLIFIRALFENKAIFKYMSQVFQPTDAVFYSIAIYEAYHFSFKKIKK